MSVDAAQLKKQAAAYAVDLVQSTTKPDADSSGQTIVSNVTAISVQEIEYWRKL